MLVVGLAAGPPVQFTHSARSNSTQAESKPANGIPTHKSQISESYVLHSLTLCNPPARGCLEGLLLQNKEAEGLRFKCNPQKRTHVYPCLDSNCCCRTPRPSSVAQVGLSGAARSMPFTKKQCFVGPCARKLPEGRPHQDPAAQRHLGERNLARGRRALSIPVWVVASGCSCPVSFVRMSSGFEVPAKAPTIVKSGSATCR